jgi:hypothetical protein
VVNGALGPGLTERAELWWVGDDARVVSISLQILILLVGVTRFAMFLQFLFVFRFDERGNRLPTAVQVR